MSRRRSAQSRFSLWRFQMPLMVAVLAAITIVATLTAWLFDHSSHPASPWVALLGQKVWEGEAWRLVSYVFVAYDPWGFIFGVLLLYWFGNDLCEAWGARRFLLVYLGLAVTSGIVVSLIGRFLWPFANLYPHLGNMPAVDALTILWALRFPTREVRLYFLFPVNGRSLIVITLLLTGIYAARVGLSAMLPHFAAEAMALASAISTRRWWLEYKQHRLKKQMRRYVDNVRRIDGRDDDDDDDGSGGDQPPPRKWVN